MGLNDRRPLRIGETQVLQIGNPCSWGRSAPLCGTPTGGCGSPCGKTVRGIRFVFLLYKVPASPTVALYNRVLYDLHGRMSSGPPQPYFVEILRRGDNPTAGGKRKPHLRVWRRWGRVWLDHQGVISIRSLCREKCKRGSQCGVVYACFDLRPRVGI